MEKPQVTTKILKENRDSILPHVYKLLITCWRYGKIPQDTRKANIITLYKNKGDKRDCNNYRGISLLSITGKVFPRIILRCIQKLADRVLPENQCCFRSKRCTVAMLFPYVNYKKNIVSNTFHCTLHLWTLQRLSTQSAALDCTWYPRGSNASQHSIS